MSFLSSIESLLASRAIIVSELEKVKGYLAEAETFISEVESVLNAFSGSAPVSAAPLQLPDVVLPEAKSTPATVDVSAALPAPVVQPELPVGTASKIASTVQEVAQVAEVVPGPVGVAASVVEGLASIIKKL